MKLYEIKTQYEEILFKFRNAETEVELAEIADELAAIEGTLEEKLDNCGRVFRTLESEAEVYKQESRRLAGKANTLENRADRLRDYVGFVLGVGNKAKTALFDFSWRKSEAVKIEREDLLPESYKRTKTIVEPDKIIIKQDLKGGIEVPGASLATNFSLQIK